MSTSKKMKAHISSPTKKKGKIMLMQEENKFFEGTFPLTMKMKTKASTWKKTRTNQYQSSSPIMIDESPHTSSKDHNLSMVAYGETHIVVNKQKVEREDDIFLSKFLHRLRKKKMTPSAEEVHEKGLEDDEAQHMDPLDRINEQDIETLNFFDEQGTEAYDVFDEQGNEAPSCLTEQGTEPLEELQEKGIKTHVDLSAQGIKTIDMKVVEGIETLGDKETLGTQIFGNVIMQILDDLSLENDGICLEFVVEKVFTPEDRRTRPYKLYLNN